MNAAPGRAAVLGSNSARMLGTKPAQEICAHRNGGACGSLEGTNYLGQVLAYLGSVRQRGEFQAVAWAPVDTTVHVNVFSLSSLPSVMLAADIQNPGLRIWGCVGLRASFSR